VRSGEYYKAYCTIASCEDTQLRVYSHGSADAQNPDHSDLPALVSDLLTNHKNRDNIFDVAHRGTRHYDRHVQHKKARLHTCVQLLRDTAVFFRLAIVPATDKKLYSKKILFAPSYVYSSAFLFVEQNFNYPTNI